MGVVKLALRRDYGEKIVPCRILVWLGRRTRCYLAGRYKLGRSCSNSNLQLSLWIQVAHLYMEGHLKLRFAVPLKKKVASIETLNWNNFLLKPFEVL